MFCEERGSAYSLGLWPPEFVGECRPVFPIESVEETPTVLIPAKFNRAAKKLRRGVGKPGEFSSAQFPELQKQPRPFEPVAGGRARRAKNLRATIVMIQIPLMIKMLGYAMI